MSFKNERARSVIAPAADVLTKRFAGKVTEGAVAAQYISTLNGGIVFGVSGLPFAEPVCAALLASEEICDFVSAAAAELCRQNLALNGMTGDVICGDVRAYRELFSAGSFDLAVSNPPYFVPGRGRVPSDGAELIARDEASLTLGELCACTAYILRFGGRFCVVYRPERLSELLCAMTAAGIEPKRLRTCAASYDAAPSLVLVEGVRGGAPGLSVEKPQLIT